MVNTLTRVRRSTRVDGFETTFQVDYLSHFLLTNLLLELLKKSSGKEALERKRETDWTRSSSIRISALGLEKLGRLTGGWRTL
jgi:NAD(P)-dependent dehydrogenase (short-subunit alcohol dehydrogenase family)